MIIPEHFETSNIWMVNFGYTFNLRRFMWIRRSDLEIEAETAIPVESFIGRDDQPEIEQIIWI